MFNFLKKKKTSVQQEENLTDKKWHNLVDKAIQNYNSLTRNERIWFNTRVVIDSVNGGGLISYYYNSGAENIYDAIDDIGLLEMDNIVKIIKDYNNLLFKKSKVPKDHSERNEVIDKLDENTDSLLQDLENEIMNLIDDLENRLTHFLKKEKLID